MEGYDKKAQGHSIKFWGTEILILNRYKGNCYNGKIPDDMILNWDQAAIKYTPLSNWTMDKEGSKQVEVVDIDNRRQSNSYHTWFAASLSGHFLPIQLVYEGKTTKCHPAVKFPEGW